jgi:hypothetical protein
MPLQKLQFRPGINKDQTNYTNEGGWFSADKIRFRSGYPEKIGGWVKATLQTFLGTCRQMFNYITSFNDNILAMGTNLKVYLQVGGSFYDITPIQHTSTTLGAAAGGPFTATNGSSIITVSYATDTAYVPEVDNFVSFSGATTLGGNITASILNSNYQIKSVNAGATTYTIDVLVQANASDTAKGGTTVTAKYEIDVGPAGGVDGYGWGVGGWGGASSLSVPYTFTVSGTTPVTLTFSGYTPVNGDVVLLYTTGTLPGNLSINTPYYIVQSSSATCKLSLTLGGAAINTSSAGSGTFSASVVGALTGWGLSPSTPVFLPQQDWWFDSFFNDLVMNIRNGAIYIWERGVLTNPSVAYATRAVKLDSLAGASDVPLEAMQVLASQNGPHLMCFGATPFGGGDFDPLLIRWSQQDIPEDWTPGSTSSAGFTRCTSGSQIVRAISARQEIVVFTDTSIYSLQYTATIDAVFTLQQLADNISIISPRAPATVNNTIYWMGKDKFYAYNGRVETLPCTIRNYIFQDINFQQSAQIVSGTNEGWNEVWWFYPSAESTTNNRYVIYNHLERIWYYGNIDRTAWLDSPLREYPQAVSAAQPYLYNHESGTNDDELPLEASITSSDYDLQDGDQFILVKRIIPDVNFTGSTNEDSQVKMQFLKRNFPGNVATPVDDNYTVVSDLEVNSFTEQVFTRLRARQIALKISSQDLGVQWQLGSPRMDGRPDGKR